jgi:hypothetical protein
MPQDDECILQLSKHFQTYLGHGICLQMLVGELISKIH